MNKIKELEVKINKARHDYYNEQSTVSDKLFDTWVDELSSLDPKNLAVIGIGAEPVSAWPKYTHKYELGSLNKAQNAEEFLEWSNKYMDKGDEYFLTLKLDGLSVSLVYENGVLVSAATRGSGVIGDLITQNVARMQGVPLRLKEKLNITVRGEILLSKENLIKHFPEISNERNGASGIAKKLDAKGSDKLSVLVYQLRSDDLVLNTQEDQFKKLIELGFNVPTYYLLKTVKEVEDIKAQYHNGLRDKYDYCLDGLVIHNNNLVKQEAAGSVNGRPKCSVAYKFDSVSKEAYISDIIVQTGNSGRKTPVAVFSPKVNLMGAEVERATLHNFGNIQELGIDIGCKVLVCRSGDVIPFVEEVSESTGTVFKTPITCSDCNAVLQTQGEYLQCPNTEGCHPQQSGRVKNWVAELNILELGETLIEKLVSSNLVEDVSDLYTLTIDDLASLDRMGKKSAKNVYDSLWKNNPVNLELFIGGLSIPFIGSSTIKLLMEAGYDNLGAIRGLDQGKVEAIKGIGPVKAESLVNGLVKYGSVIDNLLKNGVKIKEKVMGKLTGSVFVFTGAMVNKRNILEQMVIDNGGSVKSSVSKGVTHLVISDPQSMSSKAVSARKLGTQLISEDQFLAMLA